VQDWKKTNHPPDHPAGVVDHGDEAETDEEVAEGHERISLPSTTTQAAPSMA
jgi:hypothetical protein